MPLSLHQRGSHLVLTLSDGAERAFAEPVVVCLSERTGLLLGVLPTTLVATSPDCLGPLLPPGTELTDDDDDPACELDADTAVDRVILLQVIPGADAIPAAVEFVLDLGSTGWRTAPEDIRTALAPTGPMDVEDILERVGALSGFA